MRQLWYRLRYYRYHDALTHWGYRLFYCSIHGHQRKFSASYCVTCCKEMGW